MVHAGLRSSRRRGRIERFRFAVCAALLLVLAAHSALCASAPLGPTPSAADIQTFVAPSPPIAISSIEDLQKISFSPGYRFDGAYVLTQDIDASVTATWNDNGTTTGLVGFRPIEMFSGVFDGQGHTIRGLVINRTHQDYVGLFVVIEAGGQVKNVGLLDGSVSGGSCVGGLAGGNSGSITGCYATATVTGSPGSGTIGGLVGQNGGLVEESHAGGSVSAESGGSIGGLIGTNFGGTPSVTRCYATGAVWGDLQIGGLVGNNQTGTITECWASGAASGRQSIGGLVGRNLFPVTQCYATGPVLAFGAGSYHYSGGLIGWNDSAAVTQCYAVGSVSAPGSNVGGLVGFATGGTVTACYWDTQASGQAASVGGTGKTTTEMKQQATFAGWDFVGVWTMEETLTYPHFFQFEQPPFAPTNVLPAGGATAVGMEPTLVATAFADPNTTDTHVSSQWQVRAASSPSSWTLTVFDSDATTGALSSCIVTSGSLLPLTDYWWRVRYADSHSAWGPWSSPTTFRTGFFEIPAAEASDGTLADRIRVTWNGAPGIYYRLYRSAHPTTATATAVTGWSVGTTYDDLVGAAVGQIDAHILYYYWVRMAEGAGGESASGFGAPDAGWAGSGWVLPGNYKGAILIVY